MRNTGIIFLSAGVLFVGFALLTPLLFFLIGALLEHSFDLTILLGMEYALLSCIGLVLLILGYLFSAKWSPSIIVSSGIATLAMVLCLVASEPKGVFYWIVRGCYFLSLLTALGMGIGILHTKPPYQE